MNLDDVIQALAGTICVVATIVIILIVIDVLTV